MEQLDINTVIELIETHEYLAGMNHHELAHTVLQLLEEIRVAMKSLGTGKWEHLLMPFATYEEIQQVVMNDMGIMYQDLVWFEMVDTLYDLLEDMVELTTGQEIHVMTQFGEHPVAIVTYRDYLDILEFNQGSVI